MRTTTRTAAATALDNFTSPAITPSALRPPPRASVPKCSTMFRPARRRKTKPPSPPRPSRYPLLTSHLFPNARKCMEMHGFPETYFPPRLP
jgi:hypothetical protein